MTRGGALGLPHLSSEDLTGLAAAQIELACGSSSTEIHPPKPHFAVSAAHLSEDKAHHHHQLPTRAMQESK